ncbi:MAG: serine hydrolase domain-containing protein [Cyclobacteriaceae bacterium]
MKNSSLIFLIICIGCSTTKKVNEAFIGKNIYDHEIANAQADLIAKTLSEFPNNSEIAIGLVLSDRIIFYGLARAKDSIKNVDNAKSVFEIGSITKVFTTQLLLNLLAEQKIRSLDESIDPYLDFVIKGNPSITFRQLANHTSGLPSNLEGSIFNTDASNPYKDWDKAKLVEYFAKDVKLESKPGEKYQYSNIGMALLAYIITKLESREYEYLLQEEIFKPLKMDRSTTQRDLVQSYLVQGYDWKGQPTANWDLAEMKGAGAILSTVTDLSKYLIWNFDALNNQLSLMKQQTKSINDNLDIALGWHIVKNENEEPFLWHNGGTGGYKSSMAINLDNNTGVVVLTNIGATDNPKRGLIDRLCFDLIKSLDDPAAQ